MNYYGHTDIGNIRANNEDSFAIKILDENYIVSVVADGMCGHKGGKEASSFAASEFVRIFEENASAFINYSEKQKHNFLKNAVIKINKQLYKMSQKDEALSGMGTTLVACVIHNSAYYIANVGDSRLYTVSTKINQITKDHSFVSELVDMGVITKEQAKNHPNKNVITRALGTEASVEPDIYTGFLTKDDTVLICTDGLTNMVSDETILGIIKDSDDASFISQKLVSLAKDNGGTDNITAVIIKNFAGGETR